MRKILIALASIACVCARAASLTMTWDANSTTDGVTQYRVYQSDGSNPFVPVGSAAPPTVTFTAVNLSVGATYRWYVTAVNSVGESAPSNTITNVPLVVPKPPTGLKATAMSSTRIDLNWQDASDNELGFVVARSIGTGPFSTIATIPADRTSYIDTWQLMRNKQYCYYVASFNSIGSAQSGISCERTLKR